MRLHTCIVGTHGTKIHLIDLDAQPQWWRTLCGQDAAKGRIDYEKEAPTSLRSPKYCILCKGKRK